MARFDYHRVDGDLLLDCQADTHRHLNSRVVAPLLLPEEVPSGLGRLHPIFEVEGEQRVLATHLLTAMPLRTLGHPAGSLRANQDEIMSALDMLLTGF